MAEGYFDYKGGQLFVEVEGKGDPIVFIHGFTLDHRMWTPQVEFFSQYCRTITYDLRGFGKSDVPTEPYTHHDDLQALLKHIKITRAHIVGLAMGGRVAINLALAYPEMVRTLTLIDSSLDGYPSTVDWNVHPEQGTLQAKQNWLDHDLFKATKTNPKAMEMLLPMLNEYAGWHWFNDDPEDPKETDARVRLGEIEASTLIMVGEKDLPYFHDIADVLDAGIRNSRKVVIKGVGHMVNLEDVVSCNTLIADQMRKGSTK